VFNYVKDSNKFYDLYSGSIEIVLRSESVCAVPVENYFHGDTAIITKLFRFLTCLSGQKAQHTAQVAFTKNIQGPNSLLV